MKDRKLAEIGGWYRPTYAPVRRSKDMSDLISLVLKHSFVSAPAREEVQHRHKKGPGARQSLECDILDAELRAWKQKQR